ncbi:MAG: hypothetical protein HF973_07090 [Chloroflexi bacterium]|nr:hypothetical protein [Chloroflexota bacterium]
MTLTTLKNRLHRAVDAVHLIYLGLLPALAAFAALTTRGNAGFLLIFLGGVAVVGVYLAVIASYWRSARSLGAALLMLLDGPVFAALAQGGSGNTASFIVSSFAIDAAAIWAAIMWLAWTTARPTKGQRIATIAFGLLALSMLLWTFWPFLGGSAGAGTPWKSLFWLTFGAIEAVIARYRLLEADTVTRDTEKSAQYILVFIIIWLVALFTGSVIYDLRG